MPDDVMGNEELSRCLRWVVFERDSPMQKDGRAKVLGIGFEVFGLKVFELGKEGHDEWQSYPSGSHKKRVRKLLVPDKKLRAFRAKALRGRDRLLHYATVKVERESFRCVFYAHVVPMLSCSWWDVGCGNIVVYDKIASSCFILLKQSW
jgi:hypothetical protein